MILDLKTPRVFVPLTRPCRYKGAHGGRGSGKSHFFAESMIADSQAIPGLRSVCVREVQKSLKDSAKLLIEDKIRQLGVAPNFRVLDDEIRTPGGGLIIFRGMQDYNAETIKSLEGFDRAWVEEAQTLSDRSWELLRPTIRRPGSEIWASWNPRHVSDPVDAFFRGQTAPPDGVCVRANYSDNPFFPVELEMERAHDAKAAPDRYAHIWLGDYEPMAVGAIWNRQTIHNCRWKLPVEDLPPMTRLLVAADPAVSSLPGANEHGIIVAGLGEDGRGYVFEDASTEGPPKKWATRAVTMFDKWEADAIVAEVNQGGDMVAATIKTVRESVPVIGVRATRGKHVRAEPIAALYETGQVCHVSTFGRLEDQMCQMTAAGFEGEGSPDHVDALVWALTELFPAMTSRSKPSEGSGVRSEYDTLAGVKADYDAMEG